MRYVVRGSRADRVLEGALVQALFSGVKAWSEGKPRPLLHAAAGLVAGAEAQSHHRLADRGRSSERYAKTAEQVAEVTNKLLDLAEAKHAEPAPPQLPPPASSSALRLVREAWNAVAVSTRRPPAELHVPSWIHSLLTEPERQQLRSVCQTHGTLLLITESEMSVRAVPHFPSA